ncbi:hypothetical protein OQA88_13141 [Cercophora sp. LCS_1]
MLFAFGPKDSFYFYCNQKSLCYRTEKSFNSVVTQISIPHSVILGYGDTQFLAFYTDTNSTIRIFIDAVHPSPSPLKRILDGILCDPNWAAQQWFFTLGVKNTCVLLQNGVQIAGTIELASEIPKLEAIMRGDLRVKNAALGFDHAWWVQFENGDCAWDFGGNYPELDGLLRGNDFDNFAIDHLSLSRYHPNHYFLVYDGHNVHLSMYADQAEKIKPMIEDYRASRRTVNMTFVDVNDGEE